MPADPKTTEAKPRYVVRTSGFWSFIVDTTTGKDVSHGYDLVCDADHYAELKNADGEPDDC